MKQNRWIILAAVLGSFAGLGVECEAASSACASTPAGALVAAKSSAGASSGGVRGFRVEAVRWDPLLRRAWAVIQRCDHLEQPSFTVLTDLPAPHGASASALEASGARPDAAIPLVRAGDLVRLWKREAYSRIELIATSEENGAVGGRVRVRLATPKNPDGQAAPPQYLAGIVRGPADVEMEP